MTVRRWAISGGSIAATLASCLFATLVPRLRADEPASTLGMTKPVACTAIYGFANFEAMPEATLTADDKLTIYYEPSGFVTEPVKREGSKPAGFHALLAQDGRIRKKGEKDPLWKKSPMFTFEPRYPDPPFRLYMRSDLSLKGLPPGEYELDLTLRDTLAKGEPTATRTLPFRVVPPPSPRAKGDDAKPDASRPEPRVEQKPESLSGSRSVP